MAKMWTGRTDGKTNKIADDFNSSISFDKKLYAYDIKGSIAHASMLCAQNIISSSDADLIIDGLESILADLNCGKLEVDLSSEDIHMFIEEELTKRIGSAGKKLHTARSRNDQVALDIRLYVADKCDVITSKIKNLLSSIYFVSQNNVCTIMPGYTHLQRAQPISFAHHLLAYAEMLKRDIDRLFDVKKRTVISPLGSAALAGTTYNIDRNKVASLLGFTGVTANSLDGVSDRDFCVEFLNAIALIMTHLSRFSEELILWSSWEFKFVEISNDFTTGSSIMPQKKNSDMAELVRGKTGRVYGNLMSILTVLKGLPLAYNKDMQEDKECVFDSVETVENSLDVFAPMVKTLKVLPENMLSAAKKGFINATDLADYLAKKGVPFRDAYKLVGTIVSKCIAENKTLEDITINEYKNYCQEFESDVYSEISLENCINKRLSVGGTGYVSVKEQLYNLKSYLNI